MRKLITLVAFLFLTAAFAQDRSTELAYLLANDMNGTIVDCGMGNDKIRECFELTGSVRVTKDFMDLIFLVHAGTVTTFTPWLGSRSRSFDSDARGVRYFGQTYQVMLVETFNDRFRTMVIVSQVRSD